MRPTGGGGPRTAALSAAAAHSGSTRGPQRSSFLVVSARLSSSRVLFNAAAAYVTRRPPLWRARAGAGIARRPRTMRARRSRPTVPPDGAATTTTSHSYDCFVPWQTLPLHHCEHTTTPPERKISAALRFYSRLRFFFFSSYAFIIISNFYYYFCNDYSGFSPYSSSRFFPSLRFRIYRRIFVFIIFFFFFSSFTSFFRYRTTRVFYATTPLAFRENEQTCANNSRVHHGLPARVPRRPPKSVSK